MPTVDISYQKKSEFDALVPVSPMLRAYIADVLTCQSFKLTPEEVSMRFMQVDGAGCMMNNVNIDITAHAFPERVEKQDKICHDISDYLRKEVPSVGEVKVWLRLCQLGHNV